MRVGPTGQECTAMEVQHDATAVVGGQHAGGTDQLSGTCTPALYLAGAVEIE